MGIGFIFVVIVLGALLGLLTRTSIKPLEADDELNSSHSSKDLP